MDQHSHHHDGHTDHRHTADGRTTAVPTAIGRHDLHTADPGDSHDKGELSLCVGEAA